MTIQIAHRAHHCRHGRHPTRHTTRLQFRSGRLLNDGLSSSQRQTQTQTNPFYSVLDHFPVGNPSVIVSVSDGDMVTTTVIPPMPFPYSSSSSTSFLKQPTTYLDSSALPTASTPLAPTKLQLGFQSSSSPAQLSPSQRHFSGPTIISSFTGVSPAATLANSESQKDIHLISSSAMHTFSLPRVATDTALPKAVTFSLSASVSITSIKLWSTVVPPSLPTTSMIDADVSSHTTDLGRPAAKAVGNALSYQATFGAPSSPTIPFALYPHQEHHLRLNPVTVVGCVLAGILSLTVAFFCVVWVLRARRRSRDDRMAIH